MRVLWLILSSLLCGVILGMFSLLRSPTNLIFSFGAIILSIYIFRKYERLAPRIWYGVLSIVFYLIFIVVLTMIRFVQTNPIPA